MLNQSLRLLISTILMCALAAPAFAVSFQTDGFGGGLLEDDDQEVVVLCADEKERMEALAERVSQLWEVWQRLVDTVVSVQSYCSTEVVCADDDENGIADLLEYSRNHLRNFEDNVLGPAIEEANHAVDDYLSCLNGDPVSI